jgi:hypothetical protein
VYRADRDGELYLCRHCASRLWPTASAQGWTMCTATEHALVPEATYRARLVNLMSDATFINSARDGGVG